ncbi:MAG TPA: nucleotide sugar dehydrogenase [Clostridia bacterium]|nr:nucleotide sugar dehydrogenase [Clostridia bacterium]
MKQQLLQKIADRSLVMGVIGLGYVGLPLAVEKARAGFHTIGFDVQRHKVDAVNKGENYIGEVVCETLGPLVKSGRLRATDDFSDLSGVDFIAVCVPTPLDRFRQPDLSFLSSCTEALSRQLHPGMAVVLESTTYPGTTEELLRPTLEEGSGLICGEDFYLGFSPERVDVGNRRYSLQNTPKVVSGIGTDASEVIAAAYEAVLKQPVHIASSPAVAEMEKLLENSYRSVNIALINELAMLCHEMKLNVWDVIEAANTKPYGFQAFYPGLGPGGHCIPVDPCYLSWKAREYGFHTTLIDCATAINDRMPDYCVGRIAELLSSTHKAINGAKILLLGVAFKQDVSDCRESPALRLMALLFRAQAELSYYDPHVSHCSCAGRIWHSEPTLTEELLHQSDLVIIATAHTAVDYTRVARYAPMVFDVKNAMKEAAAGGNIVPL